MSPFAARQRASLLVLAAISDAQALERSVAATDVMDTVSDTRPFLPADITICTHMYTSGVHEASCF
jgi:hypothetical protein